MSRPEADVCLILEGSYPYLRGGVSSWVHQVLTQLPEISFSIFYLGAHKDRKGPMRYRIPGNVIDYQEVFLYDSLPEQELVPGNPPARERREFYRLLDDFYKAASKTDRLALLWNLVDFRERLEGRVTFGNLCEDRESWMILQSVYETFCPEESFIDFFWTARFLHISPWRLLDVGARPPKAKLYHSASTGFAGFVGALAARRYSVPYLITEHGIYVKERIAEISMAKWIHEAKISWLQLDGGLSKIKQMWINLFSFLGECSYDRADRIVTLYEGNTRLQEAFGADPRKLAVIPNGIEISCFDPAFKRRRERLQGEGSFPSRPCVGFIGRIVPIKDVKTLLRAAKLVAQRLRGIDFKLVGPLDQDPDYYEECRQMVVQFGLQDQVSFTGCLNVPNIIHEFDVVVLTSFSEGQPLAIMEAFAAGIPVITTDVGSCRELVLGRDAEDKAIGRAGYLTRVSTAHDTANALLRMIEHPDQFITMGEVGRARMEKYYQESRIMDCYRKLYTDHSWAKQPAQKLEKVLSTN